MHGSIEYGVVAERVRVLYWAGVRKTAAFDVSMQSMILCGQTIILLRFTRFVEGFGGAACGVELIKIALGLCANRILRYNGAMTKQFAAAKSGRRQNPVRTVDVSKTTLSRLCNATNVRSGDVSMLPRNGYLATKHGITTANFKLGSVLLPRRLASSVPSATSFALAPRSQCP